MKLLKPAKQREYIHKQAMIYGKDPTKKLTQWHEKVNASYELALSDPNDLMLPKQELIQAAQKKKSVIKATTSKARVVPSTFII